MDVHPVTPDAAAIVTFVDVVFSYCDGLIPVRSFAEKGQAAVAPPRAVWLPNGPGVAADLTALAIEAAQSGMALYVVPGTVAEVGQARAADVQQMQALVVDLDTGEIPEKLAHLVRYLGKPTLVVCSGGRTPEGLDKLHVWWRLNEPAEGSSVALLCRLRGEMAEKVGGDRHFRSPHQPIRVAGTLHQKDGHRRLVVIQSHNPDVEVDLLEFAQAVDAMPALPGPGSETILEAERPSVDGALTTPLREGGEDRWTRFEGASVAIGHFVRLAHQGRLTSEEAWEQICGYNAAMLRPPWPIDRFQTEVARLTKLHATKYGPPHPPDVSITPAPSPTYTLGALLDDRSPMPDDLIAPRVLTQGGMLVLGGAPKVGKSDFLINLLVRMAAGLPFLRFIPPRPLRVFYLQAEIQYDYLRERMQNLRLAPVALKQARDNLIVTPKLKMLLDDRGLAHCIAIAKAQFAGLLPDIICIDPIRNLFDGGPDGGGENDNTAMLFFLQQRVEAFRDAVAPNAGLILCHHTKKLSKLQLKEDPFMALSGASALRSFYTSGMIMFRPDEERPERRLEIELRNGPALEPMTINKVGHEWVEVSANEERLVRQAIGERLDSERDRKRDVILQLLFDQAGGGKLYTAKQFAETFENQAGLGGQSTIRERISVLATKGYIKFLRDARPFGLPVSTSRLGYLVVEGMHFGPSVEDVAPDTGEVSTTCQPVLPSHFKAAETGLPTEVENPKVWVYAEGEEP